MSRHRLVVIVAILVAGAMDSASAADAVPAALRLDTGAAVRVAAREAAQWPSAPVADPAGDGRKPPPALSRLDVAKPAYLADLAGSAIRIACSASTRCVVAEPKPPADCAPRLPPDFVVKSAHCGEDRPDGAMLERLP